MDISVEGPSTLRIWFTALRPFAFTASVCPVLLGAMVAWSVGFSVHVVPLFLLLGSVVCLHGAANLLNDYFDFERGVDRSINPVSGALVRGWLSGRQVWSAAMLLLCLGGVLACAVVLLYGWGILVLACMGGLLAVGYTRRGACLKYLGLGDPAIFLAFGVLPVLAGWWTQAARMAWLPIWWSVPPGLLAVSILHANNWRDRATDAECGCRTLAVRIGSRACRWYWQGLLVVVVLFILLSVFLRGLSGIHAPAWVLLALLPVPEVGRLVAHDWAYNPAAMAALDARAARLHLMICLLLCLGFGLARWVG